MTQIYADPAGTNQFKELLTTDYTDCTDGLPRGLPMLPTVSARNIKSQSNRSAPFCGKFTILGADTVSPFA
jgi:hypothetical protein